MSADYRQHKDSIVNKGNVYLIPLPITQLDEFKTDSHPLQNTQIINQLKCFAVENVRTARRFLKKINRNIDIDQLHFIELNKKTTDEDLSKIITILKEGENIGVMSESGCPGIADPGQEICKRAHLNNIRIIPLIGPSSILMALMASGLNGQQFTFHGYLPIKEDEIIKKLNRLTKIPGAHIFIETPYRNAKLLQILIERLPKNKKLCVAIDVNGKNEKIITKEIHEMKDVELNIKKQPTIFIFE